MTSRLTLDHLVYGVPDLAASIDEFGRRLGCAPRLGGRHEGLGTHNAILPLADQAYIELIAVDPEAPEPEQPRPFALDTLDGSRLITWAVRSHSIETDVERSRTSGFDPGPIIEMSRRSPSGDLLEWKLTLRRRAFGDGLVPFVIDWGRTLHPAASNPGAGDGPVLSDFTATHPDPEPIMSALTALGVDLKIEPGPQARLTALVTGPEGDYLLQ